MPGIWPRACRCGCGAVQKAAGRPWIDPETGSPVALVTSRRVDAEFATLDHRRRYHHQLDARALRLGRRLLAAARGEALSGPVIQNGHTHAETILEALTATPGLTAAELGAVTGLGHVRVARRTAGLEKRGKINRGRRRACSTTNAPAITWWPANRKERDDASTEG